jgi:hypothetical protein
VDWEANRRKYIFMADNTTPSELLEPSLPGAWIAENRRIWQMKFLNARDLAQFCHDRGLEDFREKGVVQLWQLGLLQADLIESSDNFAFDGFVYRGMNRYGRYVYSDERQLPQRSEGWGNALQSLTALRDDVTPLFHQYRFYVLYHLNRTLGFHSSPMQMFIQEGFKQILDFNLSMFTHWSRSDQFVPNVKKWNDIASLCILTEPCAYQRIFHSLKYDPFDVENRQSAAEEINQHINDYWDANVEKLYRHIGIARLEEIRRDLCFDAQMLDPNRWIHTLLCLGESELRLELEGHLGGALLLRTMAEMLRRATEEAFDTTLREEDELGKGWVPVNLKQDLYGSSRLLDDPQAGSVFVRMHGLNYKPRVHLYVEGSTEYGAFNHFFKMMGIFVPVTNLHGLIKNQDEGNQMLTFFRDSLQADIKDQIYSIVMIDGDLPDNVKVVEGAARVNQTSENEGMFGRFFLARPDFELANFEIEELEEILWKWVAEYTETSPSQADRELLHRYVKDATGSTEFFAGVGHATRSLPQLTGFEKGEVWGAQLIDYAWEHPLKRYRKRQIIEAAELTIRWEKIIHMERYDVSKKSYMIDVGSGELITRPSRT